MTEKKNRFGVFKAEPERYITVFWRSVDALNQIFSEQTDIYSYLCFLNEISHYCSGNPIYRKYKKHEEVEYYIKSSFVESQASIQLFDTGDEYKIKSPKPSGGGVGEKYVGIVDEPPREQVFLYYLYDKIAKKQLYLIGNEEQNKHRTFSKIIEIINDFRDPVSTNNETLSGSVGIIPTISRASLESQESFSGFGNSTNSRASLESLSGFGSGKVVMNNLLNYRFL